jgi:hypothetical protein
LELISLYLSNQNAPIGFDADHAKLQNAVRVRLAGVAKWFPAVKEGA